MASVRYHQWPELRRGTFAGPSSPPCCMTPTSQKGFHNEAPHHHSMARSITQTLGCKFRGRATTPSPPEDRGKDLTTSVTSPEHTLSSTWSKFCFANKSQVCCKKCSNVHVELHELQGRISPNPNSRGAQDARLAGGIVSQSRGVVSARH